MEDLISFSQTYITYKLTVIFKYNITLDLKNIFVSDKLKYKVCNEILLKNLVRGKTICPCLFLFYVTGVRKNALEL